MRKLYSFSEKMTSKLRINRVFYKNILTSFVFMFFWPLVTYIITFWFMDDISDVISIFVGFSLFFVMLITASEPEFIWYLWSLLIWGGVLLIPSIATRKNIKKITFNLQACFSLMQAIFGGLVIIGQSF